MAMRRETGSRARVSRLGLAAALAGGLAAGCGGSSPAAGSGGSGGSRVTVEAKSLPRVGMVLVSSQGDTLYIFAPDNQRQVTCTAYCADTWPPVKLPSGATLAAGSGVQQSQLGSDPDPAGGSVVTYNGWPLYTYTGDVQQGQATGQGINLNGGAWYVMRPSGKPVESALP
jgi:predicted lipoprotein with Yx(FWY)xxD motif